MYQLVPNRGAHRGRRASVAVLLIGWCSAYALGKNEFTPLTDNPNAGQVPVVLKKAPPLMPAEISDRGMLEAGGELRGCPCTDIGDYLITYTFANVFRGNIYQIDPDGTERTLCSFEMRLDKPAGATLCFFVYESETINGSYTRLGEWVRTPSGDGLDYYSSGSIDLVLTPERYYLMGVAWDDVSITFGLDSVNYAAGVEEEFGLVLGWAGLNKGCADMEETESVSRQYLGAYAQRVCFEPAPGACCLGVQCIETTLSDCFNKGGQYTVDGIRCADVLPCPLPEGVCCFDETCAQYPQIVCEDIGGTYLGLINSSGIPVMGDFNSNGIIDGDDFIEFQTCLSYGNGPVSFPGTQTCMDVCACDSNGLTCDTNGLYAPLGEECLLECDCDSNGVYCTDPPPPYAPAQYCLDFFDFDASDTIDLRDFADFQVMFGVPQDVDQCYGDPCVYERAPCCKYDGTCEDNLTEDECEAEYGAEWQPDITTCGLANCVPLGSCCLGSSCFDGWMEVQCEYGDWCEGMRCYPDGLVTCPLDGGCPELSSNGACCLYDGECMLTNALDCANTNGTYWGNGTTCEDPEVECLAYGACCAGSYCLELEEADCSTEPGFSWTAGVRCDPSPCPGACCDESDACQVLTQAECAVIPNSVYAGNGIPCEFNTCPLTAPCCIGSICFNDTTEQDCLGAGGYWHPEYDDCGEFTCP